MAVFMTQNSPGLRTSPVKRGNWVVQKVLGIPFLRRRRWFPNCRADESKSDLPVRDMLAKHRAIPFAPPATSGSILSAWPMKDTGQLASVRTKDLAGRPVDTAVTYPGGINGVGVEGLRSFIRDHRQDRIHRQPMPQAAQLFARSLAATFRRSV